MKSAIALITGASSGLGKEFALLHAENGGDSILIARRTEKLEGLKQQIEKKFGTHVTITPKDLTTSTASQEIYDEIKSLGVQVDYLINNAGFGLVGEFHELPRETQKNMILLNILSLTELTKLFLTDFIKRNEGKILNVSSTASFLPGPLQAVYFASKAYVQSFTNALSEELAQTNITVTNLMPGPTKTEFGEKSGMDKTSMFEHTASARSVAKAGYEAMLQGKLDQLAGVSLWQKFLLWMIPFVPKKMLLKMIYEEQKFKQ